MTKLFLVLSLFGVLSSIVDGYYVRPVVSQNLITSCPCGFIIPECCNNDFHSVEYECPSMNIYYTATTYPVCSQAYVTCTKQGTAFQSVGILGRVMEKDGSGESYSLIDRRAMTVNHKVLTCQNGSWIKEDMEGNQFIHPLHLQCSSSDGADAMDYLILN